MSLEQAIQENTAAIRELIVAMQTAPVPVPECVIPVSAPPVAAEKKAKTEQKSAVQTVCDQVTQAGAKIIEGATKTEGAAPVSYDDIKAPFLELAKRDLAQAQGVLAEFGIAGSLKNAKPEQYAAILARLNELSA